MGNEDEKQHRGGMVKGFAEDHPYDWAQKEKDHRYMVTWIREDETPEFYVLSEEILVTETKYQNKRWVGIETIRACISIP